MKYITDINELDLSKSYTYADYLTWQFKERVELIMGRIFKMSPAPQSQHQYILSTLTIEIGSFLKGQKCKTFVAPFDVRLPVTNNKGEPNTVVQPDLCVICNERIIDRRGCNGVPDLVVEIVSESSVKRDLHEKYSLYEQSGVKEYWIVHPNDKTLNIFVLSNEGKFIPQKLLTYSDKLTSTVLPGLEIDLNEIFKNVVKEPEEGYLPEGTTRI